MKPDVAMDRFAGAIFGQAIGDALGHPIEFEKGPVVTDLKEDNQFTDDTQMFCCIGEALISNPPHKDEEAFMQAVGKNFCAWRMNPLGGSHRAPGGASMEGTRKFGTGIHWLESGSLSAKGNGSAMRSGVVGAAYWKAPEYAFRIGGITSIPTHNNLEAILGAAAVAYLVARSIGGTDFYTAFADMLELAAQFSDEFLIPHFPNVPLADGYNDQSPWRFIAHIGAAFAHGAGPVADVAKFNEWNGDDNAVTPAVAAAAFFNVRFGSYANIVLKTVNYTGDCDTTGAIAGTIAGARFGFNSIPNEWRQRIELKGYLAALTKRLYAVSLTVENK